MFAGRGGQAAGMTNLTTRMDAVMDAAIAEQRIVGGVVRVVRVAVYG